MEQEKNIFSKKILEVLKLHEAEIPEEIKKDKNYDPVKKSV